MPYFMFNLSAPASAGVQGLEDFTMPLINFKYAPLDFVMEHAEEVVKNIIRQVPIRGKNKRVLVDVKSQKLVPNKCSCIPGWHTDSVISPNHDSRPEVHHLFVYGGAPTEFIAEPVMLRWEEGYMLSDLQRQIPDDVTVTSVPLGTINTYGRRDFHRGVHPKNVLNRLLIRVTETDVVLPNPKIIPHRL